MNKLILYRWIIALLVVLNLATIITIGVHRYQEKMESESILTDPDTDFRVNGRYFNQILGFNREQMDVFRNANRTFQPAARTLLAKIDTLNQRSFEELNNAHPDTIQLNQFAMELGNYQGQLKQATQNFYLKIISICTEEQAVQLKETFTPLFKGKDCSPMSNKQRRNEY